MPTPYARRQQTRRREVELQRRARASADDSGKKTTHDRGVGQPAPPDRRRAAATTCGWCLGPITPKSRGPVPKWCSASCRQRAWEQRRAAASGLSAVEVVERVVEVPAPPKAPPKPRHQEWHGILRELARQLDDGLVYDRHLAGISIEVRKVTTALRRRGTWGDTGSATSPRTGEWTRWPGR